MFMWSIFSSLGFYTNYNRTISLHVNPAIVLLNHLTHCALGFIVSSVISFIILHKHPHLLRHLTTYYNIYLLLLYVIMNWTGFKPLKGEVKSFNYSLFRATFCREIRHLCEYSLARTTHLNNAERQVSLLTAAAATKDTTLRCCCGWLKGVFFTLADQFLFVWLQCSFSTLQSPTCSSLRHSGL